MNFRRVPSILYGHRYLFMSLLALTLLLICILLHWGVVCTDLAPRRHVQKLCGHYVNGKAAGNLCRALCGTGDIHSLTCETFHHGKESVFVAEWLETNLVFKKAKDTAPTNTVYWFDSNRNKIYPSESEFKAMIRYTVLTKFNLSISNNNLIRLGRLKPAHIETNLEKRHVEMDNLWPLLQDHEYLCSTLYNDFDIFPQLLGSCGLYFAVEYVAPVKYSSMFTAVETYSEWSQQVKLSILIMKLLDDLDNVFVEPFHLCDIKLHHFGLTQAGNRLKFLDLDMVYPRSVINRIISETDSCSSDDQCDFFDCRARCNLKIRKCENHVANNNLQIVCEKIFLGWRNPNKVIVPGLLMTQFTPSSLATLLRQCANPGGETTKSRYIASEVLKSRLNNILNEINLEIDSTVDTRKCKSMDIKYVSKKTQEVHSSVNCVIKGFMLPSKITARLFQMEIRPCTERYKSCAIDKI